MAKLNKLLEDLSPEDREEYVVTILDSLYEYELDGWVTAPEYLADPSPALDPALSKHVALQQQVGYFLGVAECRRDSELLDAATTEERQNEFLTIHEDEFKEELAMAHEDDSWMFPDDDPDEDNDRDAPDKDYP